MRKKLSLSFLLLLTAASFHCAEEVMEETEENPKKEEQVEGERPREEEGAPREEEGANRLKSYYKEVITTTAIGVLLLMIYSYREAYKRAKEELVELKGIENKFQKMMSESIETQAELIVTKQELTNKMIEFNKIKLELEEKVDELARAREELESKIKGLALQKKLLEAYENRKE